MSNKCIIYYEGEQRKIINIAPEALRGKNQDEVIALTASKLVPEGIDYEVVDSTSITEDIQQVRNRKNIEIKIKLKEFIYKPIEYNGSFFVNSEISSNALKIVKDETDEPIEWLDIDNNRIDLTTTQATELLLLMIQHRKSAYFQEAVLVKAVNDCTTIEELNNIEIIFNA